jgi:hypothetical protein
MVTVMEIPRLPIPVAMVVDGPKNVLALVGAGAPIVSPSSIEPVDFLYFTIKPLHI